MLLKGTRFGEVSIDAERAIVFSAGLIGFPTASRFVLLERTEGGLTSWLQSLDEPALAFPVVDAAGFVDTYRDDDLATAAVEAGFSPRDLAVMVIVAAPAGGATLVANVLAPIFVDMSTGAAAQIVLDPKRYSPAETLCLADARRLRPGTVPSALPCHDLSTSCTNVMAPAPAKRVGRANSANG